MCGQLVCRRAARITAGWVLFLALISPAWAQFNYTTTDGAITITGYNGPGGVVGIPSAINGTPVVAIGAQSFYNQSSITGLIVSNGVTSIGSYAFYNCANIVGLSLPNSLTNIGDKVFAACTSLTNVVIPGNCTNLGDVPFYLCNGLTAIGVNATNPAYSSSNGVLFNKTQTKLLEAPGGITGSYTVPATVTDIGDNAFWECTGLTNFAIPNGVVAIEGGAVGYCGGLKQLNIPASVTNIQIWAFYGCSNLTAITVNATNPAYNSVNGVLFDAAHTTLIQFPAGATNQTYAIPNGVTSLAQSAFSYGANLTNVTIPPSVTDLGFGGFEYCLNLANIVIPDTVTNLGQQAFAYCGNLATASVGRGVNSLDLEAFGYCTSLTNITFSGNVTNIGAEVFYQCSSLTHLALPNSVISLGFESLASCYSLAALALPTNLVNIGDDAFETCGLTNITIPASVTNIGDSVFQSCASLTAIHVDGNNPAYSDVDGVLFDKDHATLIRYPAAKTGSSYTFPDGVIRIAQGAFTQTYGLSSVILPNSLANLGQFAFAACYGLTSIVLPASVTNLDYYAFSVCYNLSSIYCYGNAPGAVSQSFYSDNTTVYYLPGTTGWAATLGGQPTALWTLPDPLILSAAPDFGVRSNSFGFTISWATNLAVVIQATTNLAQPVWVSLATNTLTAGTNFFSDPNRAKYPARFYRVASQ